MTGAELQKIIDDYCVMASNTVPGFLFMGVMSYSDGSMISKVSNGTPFAKIIEDNISSMLLVIHKVRSVITSSQGVVEMKMELIHIETDKVIYIISVSNTGDYFSILVLDRDKANVGIARAMYYKGKQILYKAVSELES